jgi:hypothetical protein
MDVMGQEEAQRKKIGFYFTSTPQFLEKLTSPSAILVTLTGRWVPGVPFIRFLFCQLEEVPTSEAEGKPHFAKSIWMCLTQKKFDFASSYEVFVKLDPPSAILPTLTRR